MESSINSLSVKMQRFDDLELVTSNSNANAIIINNNNNNNNNNNKLDQILDMVSQLQQASSTLPLTLHTSTTTVATTNGELNNSNNNSNNNNNNNSNNLNAWHHLHCWNGKFHCVPQGFSFPSRMNVKTLWDHWFLGDNVQRISAYKLIKPIDDLTTPKERTCLSKARFVMNAMIEHSTVGSNIINAWTEIECQTAYLAARDNIIRQLPVSKRNKFDTTSYITLYDTFNNVKLTSSSSSSSSSSSTEPV